MRWADWIAWALLFLTVAAGTATGGLVLDVIRAALGKRAARRAFDSVPDATGGGS